MAKLKIGDKVRVKDRANWPNPPGYRLAGSEGTVVEWVVQEKEFQEYINVRLEKTELDINQEFGFWAGWWPPDTATVVFREENLEKI